MKILIIFTGGTIGSTVKKGWLVTDEDTRYTLLDNYEYDKKEIEFVTVSPYSVLSENLSAKELNILQEEVANGLSKDYDGIIVTHGTDTLQYSAAALEYAVCGCDIPVVLVSSDYPLEDERTNGNINFKAAVEFIKSKCGKGVFVSYKNNNEDEANIHIASRILQHGECNPNVYSIDEVTYAVYDGKTVANKVDFSAEAKGLGCVKYTDDSGILTIDSYPGNSYSYSLEGVRAVILKPYHSATLDTANERLRAFCSKAKANNIPVFVVNVKPGISYESTKLFDDMNIKALPYSTYISAYMKIWAAVSLGKNVTEFVEKPIANEIIKA